MGIDAAQCRHCGHTPREQPLSGRWFCPRCGKSNILQVPPRQYPTRATPRLTPRSKSRDQVSDIIYQKLSTHSKKTDEGFKEPYLNPSIPPLKPKKRSTIRLFYKKD